MPLETNLLMMANQNLDLIIIGSGPAGLTAGIYAIRYKLDVVVLSKVSGGLANEAHVVENWPGIKNISGLELMKNFREHAESLGVKIVDDDALDIKNENDEFIVTTRSGVFSSHSIILAMGTERRKLNVEGEAELLGKGVSYCATCDGPFFKDKVVGVIGGNDSAVMSAELLSLYASKVYIIYRKDKIRAEPISCERIEKNPKIEVITNTNVIKVNGNEKVQCITLDNEYKGSIEISLDGIFIEIGSIPNIVLTKKLGINYDDSGYIKVDNKQMTSLSGVFAAGDITTGSDKFRQMITAASEGAIASRNVFEYLKNVKNT